MGAFAVAWLTGIGIISYRSFRVQGGPPWPGQLLWSSGLYVILAVIADAGPEARRLSLTLAWGFNLAAFLNLPWPGSGNSTIAVPGAGKPGWWAQVTSQCPGPHDIIPTAGGCQPCGSLAAATGFGTPVVAVPPLKVNQASGGITAGTGTGGAGAGGGTGSQAGQPGLSLPGSTLAPVGINPNALPTVGPKVNPAPQGPLPAQIGPGTSGGTAVRGKPPLPGTGTPV